MIPRDAIPPLDLYLYSNCLLLYQPSKSHTLNIEGNRCFVMIVRCNRNALFILQKYSNKNMCKHILFTFTFTFRAFRRRFCPKQLTISTFATGKKPQHITVDNVKKKRKEKSINTIAITNTI